ncbi:L-glutamate gamma-semialdehyde dehydrogenase [Solicola gregarius]|uniref:L-glutamate gamma-semialdehyde dehydrogenase n=1 Tax=Solicola gregarius TaxID=2908642 RepID=A0AA46YLB8_9ACTN|nr:L-glutamate gamma-semialdehyde dehydrogenase [Solicola gregarius]UYM05444.1 L-glutamate gamma-semialdehyde dehydrogenase [Solicola gregarius]
MDAVTNPPAPRNEKVFEYEPGTPERDSLEAALKVVGGTKHELTCTIGGVESYADGPKIEVVEPHAHAHVLATMGTATHADATAAIDAAAEAARPWRELSFDDRAQVLLRAADLLTGPWRDTINAATMLGQSKTAYQAEIDAACELADFWRFNVHFARRLIAEQPVSSPGVWNRLDHRPLEGFVYAITPFNFTAIAANLPTAPALMGNTVLWKPSPTQGLAAHYTMRLLEAAGMPPGVINLLTGDGLDVSEVALTHPDLAGVHFTGSSATFQHLWSTVGANIGGYRTYPRLVGETGGKDFVLAHSSADPDTLRTALVRGAYDYQGQKCSAASRAYVARSVWEQVRDGLVDEVRSLSTGDVSDFSHFMGAVIDKRSFAKLAAAQQRAHATPSLEVLAGGSSDDSVGYFVEPTLVEGTDPHDEAFTTEYFGPFLAVHVYEDDAYAEELTVIDTSTAYGLTGAIIADDRAAIDQARDSLRYAAGNLYVNDKPTGAVVGQQPFGGGRASGTNDKAGSILNLQRWVSPRAIKETSVAPHQSRYPHQG